MQYIDAWCMEFVCSVLRITWCICNVYFEFLCIVVCVCLCVCMCVCVCVCVYVCVCVCVCMCVCVVCVMYSMFTQHLVQLAT